MLASIAASTSDAPAAAARLKTLRTVSPAPVKIIGNQSFVVIRKYQGVELLECCENHAQEFFLRLGGQRLAALVVHAHYMLMLGDDPRFHRGNALGFGQHGLADDVLAKETSLKRAASFIATQHAKCLHFCPQRG